MNRNYITKITVYCIILCKILLNNLGSVAEPPPKSQENRNGTQDRQDRQDRQEPIINRQYRTPEEAGYRPPSEDKERQSIEFQGKRGGTAKILKLKILAPSDHKGQTLKSHPEFWIDVETIPESPIQFNLIAKKDAKSLWRGEIIPKSNLFALKYPENLPSLEPGVYILAVGYKCPQSCQSLRMAFNIVKDAEMIQQLQEKTSVEEKIKFLAKRGFWFDAQSLIFDQLAEK